MQLHEQILKQQADEKRRAERRARHMQDDLRYAMKKLPDPLDINLGYEEVRVFRNVGIIQANGDVGRIAS
jgi:pre-mRNA-processing factor 40